MDFRSELNTPANKIQSSTFYSDIIKKAKKEKEVKIKLKQSDDRDGKLIPRENLRIISEKDIDLFLMITGTKNISKDILSVVTKNDLKNKSGLIFNKNA